MSGETILDTTKLDEMIATNPGKLAQAVSKTAFRILGAAREVAPRDPARPPKDPSRQVSGALKANSDVVKVDAVGLTQRVEFYQEYAAYQELGAPAINLPARPYLTPAVEKADKQFIEDIKKALE
jgi:hypothetical protein